MTQDLRGNRFREGSHPAEGPGAFNDEQATLLDNIGEGVAIVDLDEVFVFVNPAAERIFGVEAGGLVGRNLKEFLTQNHWAQVMRQTQSRVRGEINSYELEIIRPDGNPVALMVTAAPRRDQEGRVIGSLGVFRDMTERLRAEMEKLALETRLIQASKLEAIGTLSGGIAHDFNNILLAIIGYTQLAMDGAEPGSDQRGHLEEVLRASSRAADLVRQILTYARQVDSKLEPVALPDVVEEAVTLIRSSLPASISINQEIVDSDDLVLAQQTQVHRIVMNLCTNAAQAMGMGPGELAVRLDRVEQDGNPWYRLRVSDTGCGISREHLDSIFDPYFTTKEMGEGTGLGLSVVQGAVQGFNGRIEVSSEPGQGTTFTVLLPVTRGPVLADDEEEAPTLEGDERLLLVDDEQPVVNVVSKHLRNFGYRVTAVTSSGEALALVRENPGDFDLVVTDLSMPEMNGDQLSREIRALRPELPVVLITGYDSADLAEQALEAGLRSIVPKPFNERDLLAAVRNALDGAGAPPGPPAYG